MLKCGALSLGVFLFDEEGAFYRWRGGGIWKMVHLHMEGTKPNSMYIEPGRHHHIDVGLGGKHQPIKPQAKQGQWGTMTGLDRAHLWWVNFYDLLDLAHGGVLRR